MNFEKAIQELILQGERLPYKTKYLQMVGLATFAFADEERADGNHYLGHVVEVVSYSITILQNIPHVRPEAVVHGAIVGCGHDILEDKDELFGGRKQAEKVISYTSGEDVLHDILLVTNPDFPTGIAIEEKHRLYREHVRTHAMSKEIPSIVKLADFTSNTNLKRLVGEANKAKRHRLAIKYNPLFPDFIALAERLGQNVFVSNLKANQTFAEMLLSNS